MVLAALSPSLSGALRAADWEDATSVVHLPDHDPASVSTCMDSIYSFLARGTTKRELLEGCSSEVLSALGVRLETVGRPRGMPRPRERDPFERVDWFEGPPSPMSETTETQEDLERERMEYELGMDVAEAEEEAGHQTPRDKKEAEAKEEENRVSPPKAKKPKLQVHTALAENRGRKVWKLVQVRPEKTPFGTPAPEGAKKLWKLVALTPQEVRKLPEDAKMKKFVGMNPIQAAERVKEAREKIRAREGVVRVVLVPEPLDAAIHTAARRRRQNARFMAIFGVRKSPGGEENEFSATPLTWTPSNEEEEEKSEVFQEHHGRFCAALKSVYGLSTGDVHCRSHILSRMGEGALPSVRRRHHKFGFMRKSYKALTESQLNAMLTKEIR